jgi:putative ABC transport system permease protein
MTDLRYAFRQLRRAPGFTAVAVLTLALGIGASTAIFSVVHGVLLDPLPYAAPGRLVALFTSAPKLGYARANVGAANYRDWRAQNTVFHDIALVRHIANFNLTGDGEPERLFGARVTANLFSVLGVQPLLGRVFPADAEQPGRDRIALLSHSLWTRRFGADPHIVGRTTRLSGEPYLVAGVMPPGFAYPGAEFQLWVPLTVNPEEIRQRLGYDYLAVARLRPGVSLPQAQAEMDAISARLAQQYPERNKDIGCVVVPLLDSAVGPVRTGLYVLLGAVGGLLLIGCANLTNLLLARAAGRTREFTLRVALGAGRRRLIRQLAAEVLPLGFAGGALGLLLAVWGLDLLRPLLPAAMPRLENIRISLPVLAFTAAVSLLTVLLTSLLPAWHASRTDLASALHEDARAGTGAARARLRDLLVVSEIALTLVLLVGAGLLIRTLGRLRQVDPGFRPEGVLSLHLAVPRSKYTSDALVADFCRRVLERVRALPGVESAGMVNRLPLAGGGQSGSLQFEGTNLPVTELGNVDWRTVTPGYFQAMGIPLLRGRSFTDRDTADSPLVGVIDERIARLVWPGQDPIGKRFRIGLGTFTGPWVEIVGVAGHIRHDGLDVDQRPQVYWNYHQRAQDRMALVVRTRLRPLDLAPAVISEIRAVDPDQPVYDVRPMDEVRERSLAQRWLNTVLVTLFAGVSLLLAAVGIYGVIAYSVQRRVREFGVRLALGASPGAVRTLVLRQVGFLTLCGLTLGVGMSLVLTRFLAGLLHEVAPHDPATFAATSAVLACAALAACYLPARRATRIDPMEALRQE